MSTPARISVMFVLFEALCYLSNHTQAFKTVEEMNWKVNPEASWMSLVYERNDHRLVIFVLNIPNYLNNGLEKKYITTGVLIDNSRILTTYSPFKELIRDPDIADKIVVVLVTGMKDSQVALQVGNLVCARPLVTPDNTIWHGPHSPIHDLMVVRMEEETGCGGTAGKWKDFINPISSFYWYGPLPAYRNSLRSFPAEIHDQIGVQVRISSLGHRTLKEIEAFDTLHPVEYELDDAVLADCDEWLPRQWGFFICIRNINNFTGLASGAVLYSGIKLFGLGCFAMFRNETGILVFTDLRYYTELISKTCGDEEFI